jgi:hypothetical protein
MVLLAVAMAIGIASGPSVHSERMCSVPEELIAEVSKRWPGYAVVREHDLAPEHLAMFRKDHGVACPGVLAIDFFGEGNSAFAVLVAKGKGSTGQAALVVARPRPEGWEAELLDTSDTAPMPVIWSEPPGEYKDVYDNERLEAKHPVIVLAAYESWAILYSWTGKAVVKIWIAD